MIELDNWTISLEKSILISIEKLKEKLESNAIDNKYDKIEYFEELFNKLRNIYDENKNNYEYIMSSIYLDHKEYNKMMNMERLIQKLFNSLEYIDNCISNESLNTEYIEILHIIWKY